MICRLFFLLLLFALPVRAEEAVVAGMSQNRVAITANFDGSEILIFGAVKRDAPPPGTGKLEVIVTISGPSEAIMVRRKEKRFGIWINTDAVEVDAAPSFYAVATSGPLNEILKNIEDLRYKISVPRAIRSVGAPMTVNNSRLFTEALIRIRSRNGLYILDSNTVEVDQETLFNTAIALPSNLTEGLYTARIFLVRSGDVVAVDETSIEVNKVGLERWLFNLAHELPLAYGILSLVIAIAAGWGASAAFRYLRS